MEILDETGTVQEQMLEQLDQLLRTYLEKYDPAASESTEPRFALFLVDDGNIRRLNREHRQLDEATDVLSYPLNEPDDLGFPELPFLGDVFVSLDTAARQAEAAGHDLLSEILVLAVHGHTHLRGYDHQTEEEWRTFEVAQSRILDLARERR